LLQRVANFVTLFPTDCPDAADPYIHDPELVSGSPNTPRDDTN